MENREILTICCECKKIAVDKEHGMWLAEDVSPRLYQKYMEAFPKDKISHGYCPECFEKAEKRRE